MMILRLSAQGSSFSHSRRARGNQSTKLSSAKNDGEMAATSAQRDFTDLLFRVYRVQSEKSLRRL
jgi:hypothetical protein